MRARDAYSLVEMLVVISVVAVFMGLILASSSIRRDERRALVQGAAAELASTLRQARAYAMERNIVAAVSFNIENAPGSSGWTLNNRSGGHWYQIVGPSRNRVVTMSNYDSHFPFPGNLQYNGTSYAGGTAIDAPFRYFLEAMDSAWYGDRHLLPKGKVRFLAIGDQDNGCRASDTQLYQPTGSNHFYPRPWFGRWDEAGKRLHPWGGYNPAFKDNIATVRTWLDGTTPASFTGFFYEGKDGAITGSVNPQDRGIFDDTNGDGAFTQSGVAADDQTRLFPLYQKDKPRPLIDGRWLDLYLTFYPDGTVSWGAPFTGRRNWGYGAFNDSNIHLLAPGDRVGRGTSAGVYSMVEVGNYTNHTGAWYITLAPDLPNKDNADQGRHASAEEAIASMRPMFRVYVTPSGEVGWFEVKGKLPAGSAWEATPWTNAAFLSANYSDGSLRGSDFRPRGRPAIDVLVPEMLRNGAWWLQ